MEYFGMFAFIGIIFLYDKVRRLERILRDNGIRPGGTAGLGDQVRKQVGKTVELTLETSDGDITGKQCRILDADEDWALVLAGEGKKKECEKLIRLDSVKQIKVKWGRGLPLPGKGFLSLQGGRGQAPPLRRTNEKECL